MLILDSYDPATRRFVSGQNDTTARIFEHRRKLRTLRGMTSYFKCLKALPTPFCSGVKAAAEKHQDISNIKGEAPSYLVAKFGGMDSDYYSTTYISSEVVVRGEILLGSSLLSDPCNFFGGFSSHLIVEGSVPPFAVGSRPGN